MEKPVIRFGFGRAISNCGEQRKNKEPEVNLQQPYKPHQIYAFPLYAYLESRVVERVWHG